MAKGTSRMQASVCAKQRLSGTGRTDQQDVRLREFDVVVLGLVFEAFVVIVNRDREHLLGVVLANHVVVENLAEFLRRRDAVACLLERGPGILVYNVLAQLDALVADGRSRTPPRRRAPPAAANYGSRISSSSTCRVVVLMAWSPTRRCFMCQARSYRACCVNYMQV
jgi:hypothetical protein